MTTATAPTTTEDTFSAYGAVADLFEYGPGQQEVLLCGPAGTGKSRGILEFINWACSEWSGVRALMIRQTRRSLTDTGMVTFEEKVLNPAQNVRWVTSKQRYEYPNKSILAVGGMDKPSKILSSEWDIIYWQEVTEGTEGAWETCTMRLRNGVTPFQLMLGDCNPDIPTHWLLKRVQRGQLTMYTSHHEDNPTITQEYLAKLKALTGVRRLRFYEGKWAAAEGMVFENWDRSIHLIDRFPATRDNPRGDPPRSWPRYISIDWGFTNPACIQWWAVDPDGRLYRYREMYVTKQTDDQLAQRAKELNAGDLIPRAVIADPENAGARVVFTRITGWGTVPAFKEIESGIGAVNARMRPAADKKPRIFWLRDSLDREDPDLADRKLPTRSEDEVEGYVWAENAAGVKEVPVDKDNHGMDTTRYVVAYFDLEPSGVRKVPSRFGS